MTVVTSVRPLRGRSQTVLRDQNMKRGPVPPLPTPLALSARLLPVAVLAVAGIAMTSGSPDPSGPSGGHDTTAQDQHGGDSSSDSSGSSNSSGSDDPSGEANSADSKSFTTAPAPCDSLADKSITSLVPGTKTAGKEIKSTDVKLRRTCSWNALKGYDYRWLDISFEIRSSEGEARKSYQERVAEKSGGGNVPGLGDDAYSQVDLNTEDKQEAREGTVLVRVSNALVTVTYIGSDYESKKAPATDVINQGAIRAAKEAVGALGNGKAAS